LRNRPGGRQTAGEKARRSDSGYPAVILSVAKDLGEEPEPVVFPIRTAIPKPTPRIE
jgi:hypothetical protein